MTREEAIKRLKEIDIRDALQEDYDALYMAIKALEQEPCEDCISREAVLDLLEDTNNGWIINEVSQLPPVFKAGSEDKK